MIVVLMAVYNGEKYIEEQLESIITQDVKEDFCLIVRDDCSTDASFSILKRYERAFEEGKGSGFDIKFSPNFRGISVIKNDAPTGSARDNFMKLILGCKEDADYIAFSDQDDVWDEKKLGKCLEYIKGLEKANGSGYPLLIHTDAYVTNDADERISDSLVKFMNFRKDDTLTELLIQNTVTGCTMMVNRAAFRLLKVVAEDSEGRTKECFIIHDHFAAVLIATFGRVALLEEPLMNYRQHTGNQIGASDEGSFSYRLRYFMNGKKSFRYFMDYCYIQAGYIYHIREKLMDSVDVSDRDIKAYENAVNEKLIMLKKYFRLKDASSYEKRKFFKANGMYKNGRIKKIMQLIWC